MIFFVLQEGYYPNQSLPLISENMKDIAFRANNKLLYRFDFLKYFRSVDEVENADYESMLAGNVGFESAIIRFQLKYKGAACILLDEIRKARCTNNYDKWPFSICDEIYFSSGWEDIVFFLSSVKLLKLSSESKKHFFLATL